MQKERKGKESKSKKPHHYKGKFDAKAKSRDSPIYGPQAYLHHI